MFNSYFMRRLPLVLRQLYFKNIMRQPLPISLCLLLTANVNATSISFTETAENQCSVILEKASLFMSQLQYRLALVSHQQVNAWLQHPDAGWLKVTQNSTMASVYPVKITHINISSLDLEVVITPFCKQRYFFTRQLG